MLKNIALVLAGIASATAFMIACSDDSPHDADAAVCDCPAAEPPLAGRITRVEDRVTASQTTFMRGANCPENATLLGGGCYSEGASRGNVVLVMAGEPLAGPSSYYICEWNNPGGPEVTVVAWATCLVPAS